MNTVTTSENGPRPASWAMKLVTCGVGAWAVGSALASPDLEWRVFAMAALSFAATPMSAEFRSPGSRGRVRAPLAHPVLFASCLALGPACAALPGAASGVARLLFTIPRRGQFVTALYSVLKPAAACWATAAVYTASGGNVLKPQEADALLPVVLAGLAYIAAHAAFAAVAHRSLPTAAATAPPAGILAAEWCACLAMGYVIAVIYAFAPTYVLLAPALMAPLACLALSRAEPPGEERGEPSAGTQEDQRPAKRVEFVDPATGLANARYLRMFLEREINRAQRKRTVLSLAAFDVDGSARMDPRESDRVLSQVARRLRSGLREYDLIARYCAGRLIVALPETPLAEAIEAAQRLHQSISSPALGDSPVSVTVGVASYPDHGLTAEELINSSHHALNCGRYSGANAVYSCEDLPKAS